MDEHKAIKWLTELAKVWPKSLWLFSASGRLHVMRKNEHGERIMLEGGGMDPDCCIATIPIESDGGDW